jgi:hypothetical protein
MDAFAHKRIGPDAPHQALFGDDLAGVLGKTDQHLHHLGFQANGARRSATLFSDGSTWWASPMRKAFCKAVLSPGL